MSDETIVLCFPVQPEQVVQIRENCSGRRILVSNQDDISKDIFDADIFCGHAKKEPIEWARVTAAGRLKWIQSTAAGLDHCLSDEIIESNVIVTGCSALFANQVAEHTMALLFGLLRSLPVFYRAQQKKEFVRRPTDELYGKTIGIVGFGGNGQRIAQALRPVAEKIVATDLFPESCQGAADEVYPAGELSRLLSQSDVIIVTLPLTKENEKLIGESQLATMKKGGYLINVGRGSVVDQAALIEALRSGHLAGAGLDVCDPEPLPFSSPLWELENVIITPHVGAQSMTRLPMTVELFCENLRRYDQEKPLCNLVDKNIGFPRPENRASTSSLDRFCGSNLEPDGSTQS